MKKVDKFFFWFFWKNSFSNGLKKACDPSGLDGPGWLRQHCRDCSYFEYFAVFLSFYMKVISFIVFLKKNQNKGNFCLFKTCWLFFPKQKKHRGGVLVGFLDAF